MVKESCMSFFIRVIAKNLCSLIPRKAKKKRSTYFIPLVVIMKKLQIITFAFLLLICFCFIGCKKNKTPECINPGFIPYQPYGSPVWHPDGQVLGFNHTPQTGVSPQDSPPCVWYMNSVNQDSAGFYLINKDGSGLTRVTNYYLTEPAWSPNGKWLAFSFSGQIYKMPFTGTGFDTSHIIALTDNADNFSPSWTANSDTIYYESNEAATNSGPYYSIWNMKSDGSGKTLITLPPDVGNAREPFVGSDNRIYYYSYVLDTPQIFSMNRDGGGIKQLTNITNTNLTNHPKYFNGKVFYWSAGYLYSTVISGFSPEKILTTTDGEDFSISPQWQLVYVMAGVPVYDQKFETLWIATTDGANKVQLTFNNH